MDGIDGVDGVELVEAGKFRFVCKVPSVIFDVLTDNKYIVFNLLLQIPYSQSTHDLFINIIKDFEPLYFMDLFVVDDHTGRGILLTFKESYGNLVDLFGPTRVGLHNLRKNQFHCNNCPGSRLGHIGCCKECKTKHKKIIKEYKKYTNRPHFQIKVSRSFRPVRF